MCNNQRKPLVLLVMSVVGVLLVSWYVFFEWRRAHGITLWRQTEIVCAVVFVFVEDQERMPEDIKELFALGYLRRSEQGDVYAGPTACNRRVPICTSVSPHVRLDQLGGIGIAYGGKPNIDGQLVWVTWNQEAGKSTAMRFSALIARELKGEPATRKKNK